MHNPSFEKTKKKKNLYQSTNKNHKTLEISKLHSLRASRVARESSDGHAKPRRRRREGIRSPREVDFHPVTNSGPCTPWTKQEARNRVRGRGNSNRKFGEAKRSKRTRRAMEESGKT